MVPIESGFVLGSFGYRAGNMIVTRMQDHFLEMDDGSLHMVINKGIGQHLVIVTSLDGGMTWTQDLAIPNTNSFTTADVHLLSDGQTMAMTYIDEDHHLIYSTYLYDSSNNSWVMATSTVVPSASLSTYNVHPTIWVNDQGTTWISYTQLTLRGLELTLDWSRDGGQTWESTELLLGGVKAGSARCLMTSDTEGILLATTDSLIWVTHTHKDGWVVAMVDEAGTAGHFSSHFSATVVGDDIFVGNVNEYGELDFIRYEGDTARWETVTNPIGTDKHVSSVQICASQDGQLYLIYDDAATGKLVVLESADGGKSWHREAAMQMPKVLISEPARFEAPEHFEGDLVIMLQVDKPGVEQISGLYYYVVDVDNNGVDTAVSSMSLGAASADVFLF